MPEKIFSYESENIKVTWDKVKCIHAEECVKGLPEVFNADQRPWIQPDKAEADKVAEVIHRCPTGALQYERLDGGENEKAPKKNTITLIEDGPVYIEGDLLIKNLDGDIVARETRAAFCRCGLSQNKPYCDNSHIKGEWKCGVGYTTDRLELERTDETGGELNITIFPNAPFGIEGKYEMVGGEQRMNTAKKMSLCRCGASQNKPFCDGSHKDVGFEAE
jgi:CDGSH-type Zn-finger protein/uncharacterized Fe-S cluster protein YjdI